MPVTEFSIRTPRHGCMIDITAQVAQAIADSGITDGIVTVYTPHTTSAITINENADPDVMYDLEAKLGKLMPWREEYYTHDEGNSAAHVKSSLVGASETVPLANARMLLGTWQGLYFWEFDGPRQRRVLVSIIKG